MSSNLRPGHRLFVACDLPDSVREDLADLARRVAEHTGGRPIPGENLHLTLAFLGSVPDAVATELLASLFDAMAGPVHRRVACGRLIARPKPASARLVAIELVDDTGGLERHARRVGDTARRLIPGWDARPLWPHVTLVRQRRPTSVRRFPPLGDEHVFDITRTTLYDSHIAPDGPPHYEPLMSVPLDGLAERSSSDG